MGAAGYVLAFVPEVTNYTLRSHGRHESGWGTYSLREADAFICEDCKMVWVGD